MRGRRSGPARPGQARRSVGRSWPAPGGVAGRDRRASAGGGRPAIVTVAAAAAAAQARVAGAQLRPSCGPAGRGGPQQGGTARQRIAGVGAARCLRLACAPATTPSRSGEGGGRDAIVDWGEGRSKSRDDTSEKGREGRPGPGVSRPCTRQFPRTQRCMLYARPDEVAAAVALRQSSAGRRLVDEQRSSAQCRKTVRHMKLCPGQACHHGGWVVLHVTDNVL